MKNLIIFGLFIAMSVSASGQNRFDRFNFLIGKWQGVETGAAGDGIGFRTYGFELNKNYIVVRNQSTFPKTEKKPMGEVHRDFGVMSYNSNDSSIVFREFHVEGFANIYVFDKDNSTESTFVFITREIENNPGDWKAKLRITKLSDAEFIEDFELAMDGNVFKPLLKNHWYKVN